MDQMLRTLLRIFIADPSSENAMRLASAFARSSGASPIGFLAIPNRISGYLTYAGLLKKLLELSDNDLSYTALVNNIPADEFYGLTTLYFHPNDDVVDQGAPVLARHICDRCGRVFSDERTMLHLVDEFLDDLCRNCIFCTECATSDAHNCPQNVEGCPCCQRNVRWPGPDTWD